MSSNLTASASSPMSVVSRQLPPSRYLRIDLTADERVPFDEWLDNFRDRSSRLPVDHLLIRTQSLGRRPASSRCFPECQLRMACRRMVRQIGADVGFSLRHEGRGVLLHQAVRRGLLGSVALVVDHGAFRRPRELGLAKEPGEFGLQFGARAGTDWPQRCRTSTTASDASR